MGRSLESSQNSTLNQFQYASMHNQHDKLASYLRESEQKKKEFAATKSSQPGKPMIKGFTVEKVSEIQSKIALEAETKAKRLEESINNKNRHSMLNAALDIFPIQDFYDASTLSELSKQEFDLLNSDKLKVSMLCGRCLSSSMKISVTVSILKPFYTKSSTFDIDNSTIIDHKWVNQTINFKAKYGDLLTFRKSFLPNLTEIVEKFEIEDSNIRVLSEDIWSFDF